jgi:hypothetical protein
MSRFTSGFSVSKCPVCGAADHRCGLPYKGDESLLEIITKTGGLNLIEVIREVRPGVWATFQEFPPESS